MEIEAVLKKTKTYLPLLMLSSYSIVHVNWKVYEIKCRSAPKIFSK